MPAAAAGDGAAAPADERQALLDAAQSVLAPLARLAVARGLPSAALEEALRRAMVRAAVDAHPQLPPQRSVSRISTATGLHRREVTRLLQPRAAAAPRGRSLAGQVFAHWVGTAAYHGPDGAPRALPRLGPAPSFETLAQAVTRDVHPRSLLDELLRLRLAELDEGSDTVRLLRDGFVPSGDRARLLGFLADNVGDHIAAAVDNVLGDGRRHFEQALFADGLSVTSLQRLRTLVGPQWRALLEALVPAMEQMVAADAADESSACHRVRIGLYAYDDDPSRTQPPAAAAGPLRRTRKT